MRIETNYWRKPIPNNKYDWSAIDSDTYDGAPDSPRRARAQGFGSTEEEAIQDLREQLEE
jgi:hypothetical protein